MPPKHVDLSKHIQTSFRVKPKALHVFNMSPATTGKNARRAGTKISTLVIPQTVVNVPVKKIDNGTDRPMAMGYNKEGIIFLTKCDE